MLKDFFNRIYEDNLDIAEIISAVQSELDLLSVEIQSIFDDTFPVSAALSGILKWEAVLGISADPITETTEFRRVRILSRLSNNIPFTERMLCQIFDNLIGEGNWEYEMDFRNYTIRVKSLSPGKLWLAEMTATLQQILPANLVFVLVPAYNSHAKLAGFTHGELAEFSHEQLREEILYRCQTLHHATI